MSYAIKNLLHINTDRKKVFESISTVKGLSGWWTAETTCSEDSVSGETKVEDIISFHFGDYGSLDMKVIELIPNEQVVWECVESPQDWTGTTITFSLSDYEGKTRLRFSHDGFVEQDDLYANCSFSWGRYLESLRQLCQTGNGEAYGSPGYRV